MKTLMKVLLTTLLVIISFNIIAQEDKVDEIHEFLIQRIIEETDSYIIESDFKLINDNTAIIRSYTFQYSESYDFELFRIQISNLVNSYSDVYVNDAWKRYNDTSTFKLLLRIESSDKPFLSIYFNPGTSKGFIIYIVDNS